MQKYPLKLQGYTADYIWGGQKLAKNWGKQGEQIAESWELSLYPERESVILNGMLAGLNLAELMQKEPAWFGKAAHYQPFPLLVKLIDAAKDLSIQVHPSDEYAARVEGGYGKSEMWYVAEAEPDASIYFGLKQDMDKPTFLRSIKEGKLEQLLNKVKIKEGDCVFIGSGTLHAINAGATIIETQQNSNLTYRVYDYNRKDQFGNLRELHIQKALEVSKLNVTDTQTIKNYQDIEKNKLIYLGGCRYFASYIVHLQGELLLGAKDSFLAFTVISGSGKVAGEELGKGDTYLLPCGFFAPVCAKDARLIITKLGED